MEKLIFIFRRLLRSHLVFFTTKEEYQIMKNYIGKPVRDKNGITYYLTHFKVKPYTVEAYGVLLK